MAELIGLVVALVMLTFALLPILTFLRLGRLSRDLEELADRVRRLEAERSSTRTAAAPGTSTASLSTDRVPAPPPAAPAPPVTVQPHVPPPAPAADVALEAAGAAEAPPQATPPAAGETDLESRIGGRGLLYTGVVVILLGASFFLKYAFDNEWIGETGRVVLGALSGLALVAAGVRFASGGLTVFGQALIGLGFAILYLVVYAALSFYQLIAVPTAFGAMVLITLGAAFSADRQKAQALAFITVGAVFLAVTGAEALYVDLGHFGRKPIVLAWLSIVFPSLLINYFGQGAYVLSHGGTPTNPFFQMLPGWGLIPMVALATAATVIASQAVISGAYSLARQAVRANVRASASHLRHGSEVLERLIASDGLLVVGAEYSLETGVVDFFDGLPPS